MYLIDLLIVARILFAFSTIEEIWSLKSKDLSIKMPRSGCTMTHRPHMSHHITCICHIAHICYIAHICHMPPPPKKMSHQPFGWKMLVTTFQFTVRYKWSERKAPVLCTCYKIHYSFSMQKHKMIQMKSVYMSGNVHSTD